MQKIEEKPKYPNSGHWIIRKINKNLLYSHKAEAWALLKNLNEEYPKTSVLIENESLSVQIFSINQKDKTVTVKKYSLSIRPKGEKFFIEMKERHFQGRTGKFRFDDLSYRTRIQRSPIRETGVIVEPGI